MNKFAPMNCKKKNSVLLIIFILLNVYGYSQYTEWTNYSFANSVNSIAQEDSLLWICTDVGISCLNKNNLKKTWYDHSNSPLLEDRVLNVIIDKFHNKWIATSKGLIKYNNDIWEFVDRDVLNIGSNFIYSLSIEGDSIIWFQTKEVLYRFDGEFTQYQLKDIGLKHTKIIHIAIDSLGNKWFGTSNKGIIKFNEEVIECINTDNSKLPDNNINSLFIDSKGSLYTGTWGGLFVLSSNKQKVYKRFRIKSSKLGIPDTYIESICEDKLGNIWLLTSHDGLRKYSNGKFTRFNYWNTNNTEINDPKCALFDSENNLWLGTHSFGGHLFKYNQSEWQHIPYNSFPTKGYWLSMQFLEFDQVSNLWVGTDGINLAMTIYNGDTWMPLNGKGIGAFESSVVVNDMAMDSKGNRWFVSDKGLHKYDGNSWKTFLDFEPKNNKSFYYGYSSIAIDSNDVLWIGSNYRGLFRFDGISWSRYFVENSDIPSNIVSNVVIDKLCILWMQSGNTLTKFDMNNDFTVFSNENSNIPNCSITKLAFDFYDNLWVGTNSHGIFKFDGKDFYSLNQIDNLIKTSIITNSIPINDLKKNNTIFVSLCDGKVPITDIVFEDSTTVWVGTDGEGIIKINNGRVEYLNMENSGMLDDRIRQIVIDQNGYKWVGVFRKGIFKFK